MPARKPPAPEPIPPSERKRLAGLRMREVEDRIVAEIEAWRPELVKVWPRVRLDIYRRAKASDGRLGPFDALSWRSRSRATWSALGIMAYSPSAKLFMSRRASALPR